MVACKFALRTCLHAWHDHRNEVRIQLSMQSELHAYLAVQMVLKLAIISLADLLHRLCFVILPESRC